MIEEIQRQFGSPACVRYLRSLPTMQVERSLPDEFDTLLSRLDNAEERTRRRS